MSEVPTRNALPEALFRADNLPTVPAVAVEVLRLCRDENTSLDDLAHVLSLDAALSARLLRFANSSLYDMGGEVSTLQRATLVLGMKTVQLMSLTFSLASSLPRDGTSGYDYAEFWRRSVIRAVAGRAIAGLVGSMTEDEAFVCGLLGEFGQVVLAGCLPQEYAEVYASLEEGVWPRAEDERPILGFDNCDVGRALLEDWHLPDLICQSIGAMGDPLSMPGDVGENVFNTACIVYLACHVTDLLTERSPTDALRRLEDDAEKMFGLTPDAIRALIETLGPGVQETSEMLNVRLPAGKSPGEILAEARGKYAERSQDAPNGAVTVQTDPLRGARKAITNDARFVDAVSGTGNTAGYESMMKAELEARIAGKVDCPLGLLCIEVDQLAGTESAVTPERSDELMRLVGTAIGALVRSSDFAATIEEGHFVVLVGVGSPFGLRTLAERLRRGVESKGTSDDSNQLTATITIGGICLGSVAGIADGPALLEAARYYLGKATARGRNHAAIHGGLMRTKA